MTVSYVVFVLVVVFGSSSWMGTNSVWMQLPLLVNDLPESWNLPSYLAAVVQIACIGPLIYAVLHKGCPKVHLPTTGLIVFFLTLACICQLGLVFLWKTTISIDGTSYSGALYALLFGLALVNAISNVLFMPFMAQFHPAYLNAYFVGMGFSALVPSVLSMIQGIGNYNCVTQPDGSVQPDYIAPRFPVWTFFLIVFAWTVFATVCFGLLYIKGAHKSSTEEELHEGTPLSRHPSMCNELDSNEGADISLPARNTISSEKPTSLSGVNFAFLLIATALVNAQMNGVIPSIQSFATLPYSQATYHYSLTLANVASPIASFLPFFLSIKSMTMLGLLTLISTCVTGFIIFLATLSPDLLFDSVVGGGIVAVTATIVASAVQSYLRIVFASLLREGHRSESQLFWCGVFIQIGSFIGSVVMFPLVNTFSLFKSSAPCTHV